MFHFVARHVLLSSLVVAAICGSSAVHAQGLTPQERQNLEKRIKDAEAEIQSLNESIAASEEWLRKHPWARNGCPFVKAGVTFVIPKTGKQWVLTDYYAAVDKSDKPKAEKDALKAKALQISNQEGKLCQDAYYTTYQPSKDKVDALKKEIAAIRARLGAPPPAPAVAWSGSWVTPKGSKFTIKIDGSKLICDGESSDDLDQTIFQKDECEWDGTKAVQCSYIQHQRAEGYSWKAEGDSKFVWKDGVIIRTTKAKQKIAVSYTSEFGESVVGGDVNKWKQKITADINRHHGAEEFHLRRPRR